MRHALTMALQDYEGAMVIVSHDRHLLRAVTDQFLLVDEGKVEPYDGDLDAYRQWLLQPRSEDNPSSATKEKGLSRKEQRHQEAEKRRQLQPLKNQLKKIEEKIEKLQSQKQDLEQEMANPDMFLDENKDKLQQLNDRQIEIVKSLQQLEEQWLEITEKLEQ